MIYKIRRTECGSKDQKSYGQQMEIKTLKYFRFRAIQRMRKNSILKIRNEDEGWSSDSEAIAKTLTAYFQVLFTSKNLPLCEATTNSINRVITNEMNDQLSLEF